ncbi:MAG: radical SAM protein [Bacteroidia bacterium]|nr:radical SAM protein [Bacteroidia bacterium]
MSTLKEITVEVTQKCNSNCIFCSSLSKSDSIHEIPLSKLKEISTFSKNNGASNINISGGEPLLYNDLTLFLKFNKENELNSVVYTSGNADFDSFFSDLKAKKIGQSDLSFVFNYQSIDCEIFNTLTNTSDCFSLENINKNILKCLQEGFRVEVHIVPNALNIGTIYKTCKFLKTIGISQVSLLRIVYQGRAAENKNILNFTKEHMLPNVIENIKNDICDDKFSLRVGIPYSSLLLLKTPCYAGTGKLIIKYDGKVFPCEAFKESPNNESYILGDIYIETLQEIWHKENMKLIELKKSIKESSCESCPAQLLYENV